MNKFCSASRSLFYLSLATVAVPVLLWALWTSPVSAFPTYSCDGTNDDPNLCSAGTDDVKPDNGNCANCHGDFRIKDYVSLTADDVVEWTGFDLMNGHVAAYGRDCTDCHFGFGINKRTPVYLFSSGSGITVEIASPSSNGSRLTIALPRACGLPIGRR